MAKECRKEWCLDRGLKAFHSLTSQQHFRHRAPSQSQRQRGQMR